jgi:hypothetical protein
LFWFTNVLLGYPPDTDDNSPEATSFLEAKRASPIKAVVSADDPSGHRPTSHAAVAKPISAPIKARVSTPIGRIPGDDLGIKAEQLRVRWINRDTHPVRVWISKSLQPREIFEWPVCRSAVERLVDPKEMSIAMQKSNWLIETSISSPRVVT